MHIGKLYREFLREKYRRISTVHPLLGAWEFLTPRIPISSSWSSDFWALSLMGKMHNWQWPFDLKSTLHAGDKAIVLTDASQTILFASHYFETMTGYTISEAIGLRPSFLQGELTKQSEKERIGKAIREKSTVSATIYNYRKSKTAYLCKIEIYPLFNANNGKVHFVALEQEVALSKQIGG